MKGAFLVARFWRGELNTRRMEEEDMVAGHQENREGERWKNSERN